jgi:hypothetical protein
MNIANVMPSDTIAVELRVHGLPCRPTDATRLVYRPSWARALVEGERRGATHDEFVKPYSTRETTLSQFICRRNLRRLPSRSHVHVAAIVAK